MAIFVYASEDRSLVSSYIDYTAYVTAALTNPNFVPISRTQLQWYSFQTKPLHLSNYQDIIPVTYLIESLLHTKRTWKLEKPEKWSTHAYGSGGVIEFNEKLSPSPDYHMLLLFPCDSQYAKSILDYPFQQKMYLFDKLDWYDLLSDAASLVIHHLKRQSNFSKDDKSNMKILVTTSLTCCIFTERWPFRCEWRCKTFSLTNDFKCPTMRTNRWMAIPASPSIPCLVIRITSTGRIIIGCFWAISNGILCFHGWLFVTVGLAQVYISEALSLPHWPIGLVESESWTIDF